MKAPTRPALRWHGGKWKLAPWIISHFPKHRVYVEPFGGAASVLLRKQRSYCEVYNDLDDWVVSLFRVLRDDGKAARLRQLLLLTPFSRIEFEQGRELAPSPDRDDVECARRLIIRSFMGFGSNAHNGRSTGFRANSNRSGTTPAHDWANYPETLPAICERLRGIVVEHRDACAVMAAHDGPDTLHYVDPPYMAETRSPANKYDLKYRMYRHELDRGGAHRTPVPPAIARRHGGAVRLPARALRHHAERLAAHRDRGARRWCAATHRSAVAQPALRRSARPREGGSSPDAIAGGGLMR